MCGLEKIIQCPYALQREGFDKISSRGLSGMVSEDQCSSEHWVYVKTLSQAGFMRETKNILPGQWHKPIISDTWKTNTQGLSGLKRDFMATVGNMFSKAKWKPLLEIQLGV